MTHWTNKRSRIYWYDQYTINDQETAFARYDPQRIVSELVETGADIVAVYATNQFGIAYYPSALWPQHPNLEGSDYVGDITEGLRAHGKKVLIYTNWLDSKRAEWNALPLGREDDPAYQEQPLASWADPSKPHGRVQALPGGRWRVPCINSPHREQITGIARELIERYRPDGFHLDMFSGPDVCVCPYCRPTLERICGTREITREAVTANWPAFIDWLCDRSASLLSELSAIAREHGVVTAHNPFAPLYIPAIAGQDIAWLDSLDLFLSECFDAFLGPETDINSTSINVRWQHATGKPSWVLRTSAPIHYAHWSISAAQWRLYAAACKANGCKAFGPCGVGTYPDTTSSSRLLKNVKDAFDFYMTDADLDDGATSAAHVGLLFSWATRKYQGRGVHDQWRQEFVGWARLLIEEHVPFDIVTAEHISSADALRQYDLLLLPNVAHLSGSCCSLLRSYVQNGGRVLATAETSLGDERGSRREDFALAGLLGIEWIESVEGSFAIERPQEPEPASGVRQRIRAAGRIGARVVAVDPAGSVAGAGDPMPLAVSDEPLVVDHEAGRGETKYIAFDLGRFYEMHGDEHIGKWMAELVDDLLPSRQLAVQAPRTVEVTLWRQQEPERTIIHLANRTVPWSLATNRREPTEIIPVHHITVALEAPYDRNKVSCRGAEVASRAAESGRLTIEVNQLDAYAAIVIEPAL